MEGGGGGVVLGIVSRLCQAGLSGFLGPSRGPGCTLKPLFSNPKVGASNSRDKPTRRCIKLQQSSFSIEKGRRVNSTTVT